MSSNINGGATVSNPSPAPPHAFNIKLIPTFHERLIVYVILTEEVGAPSEKYAESFLNNFTRMIHKGNCVVTDKLADTLSEILANGDAYETTGGVIFFKKLPAGANRKQLEEYIKIFKEDT